jgi:L-ascorbate metabolism protein UlaG (beta-lactamase superfamily)
LRRALGRARRPHDWKEISVRLTKFGHACVLVEANGTRMLIDPGVFSPGWEDLPDVTAVLVTHQHPDHLDLKRLPALLSANPDVRVFADPGSAAALEAAQLADAVHTVQAGEILDLALPVRVFGEEHAIIHADLPGLPNRGYLIDDRLFLPGDSLVVPDIPVQILGVPVAAPWMALKEAVEFLRSVRPQVFFPIHEKLLVSSALVYGALQRLAPPESQWLDLDDGRTVEL